MTIYAWWDILLEMCAPWAAARSRALQRNAAGCLDRARELFQPYAPGPVVAHEGWSTFRFEREGVPIDVLSYAATVMAEDADRLAVALDGRELWCKSLAFFHHHSPPGHPRRTMIEAFWARADG